MERLFSPCTRFYDMLESQGRERFRGCGEWFQELNLDVSTEELLSAERAHTYADLYTMLEPNVTIMWLTPHTAVAGEDGMNPWMLLADSCWFCFRADGKVFFVLARSPEHLSVLSSWVDQRRNGRVAVIPTFASILYFAQVVSVNGTVYVRLKTKIQRHQVQLEAVMTGRFQRFELL